MKNSIGLKIYLIISGLLLTVIGGSTLLMPVKMKATENIDIAGDISALNDVRAFSALLLATALLSLVGAFNKQLKYTSAFIMPLLFIALGVGRLISIVADGIPAEGMVMATVLEFVLGFIGLILFRVNRHNK